MPYHFSPEISSRYLSANIPYTAAASLCGNYWLILPMVVEIDGMPCLTMAALVVAQPTSRIEIMLNQAKLLLNVPEKQAQHANIIWTPEDLTPFPIIRLFDQLDWQPPKFNQAQPTNIRGNFNPDGQD